MPAAVLVSLALHAALFVFTAVSSPPGPAGSGTPGGPVLEVALVTGLGPARAGAPEAGATALSSGPCPEASATLFPAAAPARPRMSDPSGHAKQGPAPSHTLLATSERTRDEGDSGSHGAPAPGISSRAPGAPVPAAGGTASQNADKGSAQASHPGTGGQGAAAGKESGAADLSPRLIEKVEPHYPRRARHRGVTGRVTVKLLVGRDGEVGQVAVVQAEPEGVFEESVIKAVSAWRFLPAVRHGRKVPAWVVLPVRFSLK